MEQYYPAGKVSPDKFPELCRRTTAREVQAAYARARKNPSGLTIEEHEIIAYAEQLICHNRVDQTTFEALRNRHGVQWLVELTAAANCYTILCGIVNAFEVPAPPDGDKLPA
jgi:hypothetical protein